MKQKAVPADIGLRVKADESLFFCVELVRNKQKGGPEGAALLLSIISAF